MVKIIEKAQELIKGRGDGRISLDDMKILLSFQYDGVEKIKQLFHIHQDFNLTEPAKDELYKHIFKWSDLFHTVKNKM